VEDYKMVARVQILVVCCALTVACGSGSSPTTPSAATAQGAGASPVLSGAVISGTVVTSVTSSSFRAMSTSLTVSVTGTTIVATVDGSGIFTLQGVPTGTVELHFKGPGIDATAVIQNVGDHDTIHITVRLSGAGAEVEDDRDDKPDHGVEIEGKLTEVNTGARTLRVGGTLINVPAGTPIRHGDTTIDFATLRVGDRVHVKGTTTTTGVTATEVKLQSDTTTPTPPGTPGKGDDDGKDDDHEQGGVDLKGTIAGLSGTCPSISFTVSGSSVTTGPKTEFDDGACSTLKNGSTVEVKGTRQANGSVLASEVDKKK
jgi:hypothetical protein